MTTPFGHVLKGILLNRGKYQQDLASEAGIAASHISDIIHGKRPPPSDHQLARLLEVIEPTPTERHQLISAATTSNPQLKLPFSARPEEYELLFALRHKIAHLDVYKIKTIIGFIEN